ALVIPRTLPGAPTAVAVAAGSTQVALSWTAPAGNGGAAITNYQVSVFDGAGGAATGVTGATTRAVGSAATSYTFTGLTNATAYTFRVAAVNAAGTGPQSTLSGALVVGAPAPPTGVKTVQVAAGSLRVSFNAGANNGSAITKFSATCTSTNGGALRNASGPASPLTVPSLTTGKTYTCTVRAINDRGTGLPSVASAAVVVDAPAAMSATAGDANAVVSWAIPPSRHGPVSGCAGGV